MSFAIWQTEPPFKFAKDDPEQIYQVGSVWVVTDDPKRATQAEVDAVTGVTPAQLQTALEVALQAELDRQARARGYDDLRAAITYRGSSNPTWAKEADVFFAWRDAVWEKAISVLQDVQAGKAAMPTPEEAVKLMPPLVF